MAQNQNKPIFYGRRHGRRLRPAARENLAWGLERFGIAIEETAPLDMATLFGDPSRGDPSRGRACNNVYLEIGFGGGEHLASRARAAPDDGFIGAEPFINGIAKLCGQIRDYNIENIRIFPDDMRLLLPRLPDNALAGVYILFPDPWPKRRHRTRRILQPAMIEELRRLIRPGGFLLTASDDSTAKSWLLRAMLHDPDYQWQARSPADWRNPPALMGDDKEAAITRYNAKAAAAGRKAAWFFYKRG